MISTTKPFKKLEFSDDYMFYQVMQHDDICKEVLEHLLKVRIDHIERQDVQKELKPYYESHGVRLDAYIKDSKRIFNIEMQQVSKKELPKRSRYYSSMIDADSLLKGIDYTKLHESFIVFICKKDPFGLKLPVYTFKNICQENKDFILKDMSYRIFFNAAAADNEEDLEIRAFLNYIKRRKTTDNLTNKIDAIVKQIKAREENKEAYMIEHLKIRDSIMEGKRIGLKEGRRQQAVETAKKLLTDGKYTADEISKLLKIPVETFISSQA